MFVVNDLKILLKKVKSKYLLFHTEKEFVKFFDEFHLDRDLKEIEQVIKEDVGRDIAGVNLRDDEYFGRDNYFNKINDIQYKNVIEEHPYYSAGVFFLPKGTKLPLHDHKNMLVLCKMIYGKAEVKSFDKLKDKDLNTDNFEAKLSETRIIKEGEMNIVTPSHNQFHEITAIENTAFFDVLIPDYTEMNPCNYYKINNQAGKLIFKKTNPYL